MKTKTLALFSGIVGLVGGILLLVGPFFILGTAAATYSTNATAGSIVYYKGDERVGVAPSVLLIVGGSVAIIPLLGWIGGIVVLIGGSLFLGSLKKFKVN